MRQAEPKTGQRNRPGANGQPNGRASSSNMVFTSFYPTKEQKVQIKSLQLLPGDIMGSLSVLIEKGLVVTFKEDIDKSCFSCMVRENVPYGDPCKCLSFWHSDVVTLTTMVCWYVRNNLDQWLEDDRALAAVQPVDW
jgi:hypothetical protein